MEGGFEGLNLQFRTTFLNVEHFYDDQFRKERGSKKNDEGNEKTCQKFMGVSFSQIIQIFWA